MTPQLGSTEVGLQERTNYSSCVLDGALPPPQVRDRRPAHRAPRSDRDCPLDAARARCLWHAGGTAGKNDDARLPGGDGFSSTEGCPSLATNRILDKSPEGPRQPSGNLDRLIATYSFKPSQHHLTGKRGSSHPAFLYHRGVVTCLWFDPVVMRWLVQIWSEWMPCRPK
jgi:hypothetical protein